MAQGGRLDTMVSSVIARPCIARRMKRSYSLAMLISQIWEGELRIGAVANFKDSGA